MSVNPYQAPRESVTPNPPKRYKSGCGPFVALAGLLTVEGVVGTMLNPYFDSYVPRGTQTVVLWIMTIAGYLLLPWWRGRRRDGSV